MLWGTRRSAMLVGAVLLAVAVPLAVLSRWQLGDAFSVGPRATRLVTHGLYARIPHPMYLFVDLALLGGVMMVGRPEILVVWAGVIAVQGWQSARERAVLEQAFGEGYRAYRRHTFW
jgi:protein-S-isoprenylcysteine O-methyltransferase Ste14